MGRAKVRMELIKSEKACQATLRSRKSGLKKKIQELSILCGVKACMILYGPQKDGRLGEPEVWPADPTEIHQLFNKYKTQPDDDRLKRTADLVSFFKDRKEKLEITLMKERKKNTEAKYPTWDKSFDTLSEDQLRMFARFIEIKIGSAIPRLELPKPPYQRFEPSESKVDFKYDTTEVTSLRTMTNAEFHRHFSSQPHSQVNLPDIIDLAELGTTPLNANYSSNPMMMTTMLMNNDNYSELDGMQSDNVMFMPLNQSMYSDDTLLGTLDYTVVNKTNAAVPDDLNHHQTVQQLQPMPQFAQYPIMRGLPGGTQMGGYYEDNFQMPMEDEYTNITNLWAD